MSGQKPPHHKPTKVKSDLAIKSLGCCSFFKIKMQMETTACKYVRQGNWRAAIRRGARRLTTAFSPPLGSGGFATDVAWTACEACHAWNVNIHLDASGSAQKPRRIWG